VSETGKVLDTTSSIHASAEPKQRKQKKELKRSSRSISRSHYHRNGTASKESEIFVAGLIAELTARQLYGRQRGGAPSTRVQACAEEFPDFDVTQRSAVSIARRLLDTSGRAREDRSQVHRRRPVSHDMPPARLDSTLGGVVEDCVNSVGVDFESASIYLLTYISASVWLSPKTLSLPGRKRPLQKP
jgi:uncharacterized protein